MGCLATVTVRYAGACLIVEKGFFVFRFILCADTSQVLSKSQDLTVFVVLKRTVFFVATDHEETYFELVYLVTALVPSLTACLASSPGNRRRTAVCISLLVMVERLL